MRVAVAVTALSLLACSGLAEIEVPDEIGDVPEPEEPAADAPGEQAVMDALAASGLKVSDVDASCREGGSAPPAMPFARWLGKVKKRADTTEVACSAEGSDFACKVSLMKTTGEDEWAVFVDLVLTEGGDLKEDSIRCQMAG